MEDKTLLDRHIGAPAAQETVLFNRDGYGNPAVRAVGRHLTNHMALTEQRRWSLIRYLHWNREAHFDRRSQPKRLVGKKQHP